MGTLCMAGPGGGVVWFFVLNVILILICFCCGGEGVRLFVLVWESKIENLTF